MLLESPKTRFDEDTLRWKRHMASIRLKDNFKSDRQWRDDGYGYYSRQDRIAGRAVIARDLRIAIKSGLKDLALAGTALQINSRVCGGDFGTLSRIYNRHFGFDVRLQMIENHKKSWIDAVWANEQWYKDSPYFYFHDVHVSEDDPSQIAYNRNVDNIRRNIQTRTKPGKYLTQFFSDVLDQDEIRYWAQKQIAYASCHGELKFIENDNEDGWLEVYENGPQSCMRGSDSVRVYANPGNGLRLAYMEAGDNIVARCIVVDEGFNDSEVKGWLRIYATEQRWETSMLEALRAAGYDTRTNLNGIKLQLIEDNGQYKCPYIDYGSGGHQTVEVCDSGDYLLVGYGDIDATNTGGWVSEGEYCDECESHVSCDTQYVESTERTVCEHCLNEHYTYAYGDRYQEYFPNDDVIYCETDGEHYHEDSYGNHHIVYVESRSEYYHLDDCVCVNVGQAEGEWVHNDDSLEDHISGETDHCDNFTKINGNWVHETYVVEDYVTYQDVDMRESVEINMGKKHLYPYSSFYTKNINLYIHQDNLTAEVILSDFVRCGDNLYRNTYYGNPVDCFSPENVTYGDEYTGDRIEDVLVADAEMRLAA